MALEGTHDKALNTNKLHVPLLLPTCCPGMDDLELWVPAVMSVPLVGGRPGRRPGTQARVCLYQCFRQGRPGQVQKGRDGASGSAASWPV